MKRNLDDMTDAELAEWQYAHRDELDAEEGEPVDVEFAPQVSVTMSFRLSGAEADAIREAAKNADLSMSDWIRQVCAAAMDPEDQTGARHEVERKLTAAQRQLDVVRKQLDEARLKNRASVKGVRSAAKKAPKKAERGAAPKPSIRS